MYKVYIQYFNSILLKYYDYLYWYSKHIYKSLILSIYIDIITHMWQAIYYTSRK